MRLLRRTPALLSAAISIVGLGSGCHDLFDPLFPNVCRAPDETALAKLPARLSQTGLFADMASEVLAAGVLTYRPEFELWSDGAVKRRWLWLPPGTSIDSRDPDDWVFPVGTKVWKEFSRDGVRVETRLITRTGPGDREWVAQAYVWQEDGDALASPMGYQDARGTAHDVPAASECAACHGGRRSFLLGVSAVQLAHHGAPGEIDLEALGATGRLTRPFQELPVVPGDGDARATLGYLHANCGHCHNANDPANRPCFDPDNALDFWLKVDQLTSVEVTGSYRSAVGGVIKPGNAGDSEVIERMSTRFQFTRMPPLATRVVDEQGVATIRRWIQVLP
jgi:hypothetical protein